MSLGRKQGTSDLHEVHLRQLPVRLWCRAQEQSDTLMREFALMASRADDPSHEVPRRLTRLIAALDDRFSGVSSAQEQELFAAAADGRLVIEDLVYAVPVETGEASAALGELFDQADAYCAAGQLLLTMAASADVVRFRRWYFAQFVDQLAGRPPVCWPDWP